MSKFIEIKYPVDFIRLADGTQKLVYSFIQVTEEDAARYQNYCAIIERLFKPKDGKVDLTNVTREIRSVILRSQFNRSDLDFLTENQWLLKYSLILDIFTLLKNKDFVPKYSIVPSVCDAYVSDKYRRLYYGPKRVFIWEREKEEYATALLEYLFMDEKDDFDSKLNAIMLSNDLNKQQVIIDNPWVLMYVDAFTRKRIMEELKMIDVPARMWVRYDRNPYTRKNILYSTVVDVPLSLEASYNKFFNDIKALLKGKESLDQAFIQYFYEESQDHTSRMLIRGNLWLLDFVSENAKDTILNIIGLDEFRKKRKLLTIKCQNGRCYSTMVPVYASEYDDYCELNRALMLTMDRTKPATFNEEALANLISSDSRVLSVWPWLLDFVSNPDLRYQIIEEDIKKKR